MIFLDDLCCYFRGSRTRLNDSVTHIVSELSRFSCVRLFATLWTVAHQAPLSVGFSRQECWSGLPCLPWGDLPNLETEPHLPVSPALQAYYLSLAPPGKPITHDQFSSVQSLSRFQLLVTPWTAARRASLSITNCWSLLKLMSIESVMPSNHLILCHPFLLLPSIFPSNRVFSNESVLHIRWPKYWSFSFSISLSSEYSGLISSRMDLLDLFAALGTLKGLLQHHSSKASILQLSAFFTV